MSDALAIRCAGVSVAYGQGFAIEDVSGSFDRGTLTAITGPNGAGKTTLLRAVMGELSLAAGRVERPRADELAYLPQVTDVDRRFPVTVGDVVSAGLWREIGLFGGLTRAHRGRVAQALNALGLGGFEGRGIGTLSAGQFQRARFARLLLQDAPVVLLDEPFAAVDETTAEDLLALLRRWNDEGRTVVAVLHDLSQVRRVFPRTLLLARRVVAWGPTSVALMPDAIAQARRLAGQWDATDARTPDSPTRDLRLTA